MTDDITVRELELVAAVLKALYGNFVHFYSLREIQDGKYIDGYIDAIETVNNALAKRGFDPFIHLPDIKVDSLVVEKR